MRLCTFEGCEKRYEKKGYCNTHYRRVQRRGTPADPVPVTLAERFWAKVDKTDGCWNWKGQTNELGYGLVWLDGKGNNRAHRIAYELTVGPIPEGLVLDHKCHNASCVNPAHLRACTQKQNSEHKRGAYRGSLTGIRGVSWRKDTKKWVAYVTHNYKMHRLGCFEDIRDAEAAVIAKRLELFTHNDIDRQQQAA